MEPIRVLIRAEYRPSSEDEVDAIRAAFEQLSARAAAYQQAPLGFMQSMCTESASPAEYGMIGVELALGSAYWRAMERVARRLPNIPHEKSQQVVHLAKVMSKVSQNFLASAFEEALETALVGPRTDVPAEDS